MFREDLRKFIPELTGSFAKAFDDDDRKLKGSPLACVPHSWEIHRTKIRASYSPLDEVNGLPDFELIPEKIAAEARRGDI